MINIDGSVFIQIANFLLMMIVLNYLLYKPIRGILKERRAKFAGYEESIASLTSRVEKTLKDIDSQLVEARREGFLKKDEIKGQGLEEEKKIIAAATGEADAEIGKVQEQVKGEIATARQALKADLQVFSRELAQKVLGRSLA
jgi:F-type H+-transporting ATPase subunit b